MSAARLLRALSPAERRRLGALAAAVLALHVLGIGLLVAYAPRHPALTGLGWTAYLFGLRHAFDADHIAAIDNTTRKLLQDGRRPLGVGFAFSLGHSTVVFALALGLALGARGAVADVPALARYGGTLGTSVSGAFLIAIGILNLLVLLDLARIAGRLRHGGVREEELEARLLARGLMNRVFGRFLGAIREPWQMYPLGLLFGIGFDTASEIGLLALAAGAATHAIPVAAVVALPVLFAAGMSLMDTADGVFMAHAYGWALARPARKVFYNLAVTGLSVVVALGVGGLELVQVANARLGLEGGVWDALAGLDLGDVGYAIVALFALTWAGAWAVWRLARIEERWAEVDR